MSKSTKATKAPAKKAPAKAAPKKAAPAPAKKSNPNTYVNLEAKYKGESKIESPVFAMWTLCNKMQDKKRKDVIEAAVAMGISYYTARTQYQLWLTAFRNS